MSWMIWPGNAPMYVRRWPRISASSRTPPSDRRTNLRLSDFAMLFASDVLPTPGGPAKHRIEPFVSVTSWRTARNSRMRSFTFSRPKWSSFRIFSARLMSFISRVAFFHGTCTSQSM